METPTTPLPLIDLELSLLIVFISALTALGVYFVSVFGVRQKSFEEAIAEQKKRSELLLGKVEKTKKEKNKEQSGNKNKKKEAQRSNRKIAAAVELLEKKKEPVVIVQGEEEEVVEAELVEEKVHHHEEKITKHIEIVEQQQTDTCHLRRPSLSSATPAKSILLNKLEVDLTHTTTIVTPTLVEPPLTPTLNHFETLHPKDDLELKLEQKKPNNNKKQSSTLTSLLQLTPNLTPHELQTLIDALLNKQTANKNWTPTSPTAKDSLKKSLELKTTQLNQVEQNLVAVTGKLTTVRAEHAAEKTKFVAVKKQLEELVAVRQTKVETLEREITSLQNRLRQSEADVQKSLLLYKARIGEVAEEGERLKSEFSRREGEWRGKVESLEREIGALNVQYGKQGNHLSSAFQSNEDLTTQLRSLTQTLTLTESQILSLSQALTEKEAQLCSLSLKAEAASKEMSEKDAEKNVHLSRIAHLEKNCADLERKCGDFGKNELNFRKMLENLNGDLENSEKRVEELEKEVEKKAVAVVDDGVELRGAREKNDELRLKNAKLLESLQASESALDGKIKEIEGVRREVREVFNAVGVDFEEANLKQKLLEKLSATEANTEKTAELGDKLTKEEEKSQKLSLEVAHYQSVLANTEQLLASLQSSIETEEAKWLAKLADKDAKLEEIKAQLSGLNNGHEQKEDGDHTPATPTPTTPTKPPPHSSSPPSSSSSPSPSTTTIDDTTEKKKKKKLIGFFTSNK